MYLVKTPQFVQNWFPNFVWQFPVSDKQIYLTFDDGPIPGITPWVLDLLDQYQAKATFFCVGDNVTKHPDIFQEITRRGHSVGNHTHNHLSGWSSDTIDYLNNVRECALHVKSDLFRPPYGRLSPRQVRILKKQYQIILWDVLSGDFDPNISPTQCWKNVQSSVQAGSIIVFHDSKKAADKLYEVLPKTLEHFSRLGYRFEAITEKGIAVAKSKEKVAVG